MNRSQRPYTLPAASCLIGEGRAGAVEASEGGDVGRSRQQVVAGLVARGRSLGSAQDGQCYLCGEPWWK